MKYLILIIFPTFLIAKNHKAYPNPCDRKLCSQIWIKPIHGSNQFAKNTQIRLRVYNYNMKLIYEADYITMFGRSLIWPIINQSGRKVAAGLYFVFVTDYNAGILKNSLLKVMVK